MIPLSAYYPIGVAIPNFVPNEWETLPLLVVFSAACIALVVTAKSIAIRADPQITTTTLSKTLWFSLCGGIHLILEGYYASHFATLQGSQQILAQLWKEYSLSDSRYLTSDAFVRTMESVTAWAWGPSSLLAAYFIVTDNPYQHPLQIIISTGQMYGTILYLGTVAFDTAVYGIEYSRPEPYYFYGYYLMLNGFWILFPTLIIADSVRACGRAFAEAKRSRAAATSNNHVKKTA